jgi:O-methyltransferase
MDKHPASRFVGFDSFVGLPEQWRRRSAGHFNVDGAIPETRDTRVTFIKGWFNETLRPWFHDNEIPAESTTVIHIDSDVYSSCSYVLTSLHDIFPSYYVLFDEYGAGEARALRDYLAAYGAAFRPTLGRKRRSFSQIPGQVFGLITTNP